MRDEAKKSIVLIGIATGFCGLAGAFLLNLWGRPATRISIPLAAPEFTNTATVRMSAADLVRTEGDTSGFSCYTCHDAKKQLLVNLDTNGAVILAEPHKEIVMKHGRNNRNEHCFICHDSKNLESLRVNEGQSFKFTESSRLCGSCHGPNYRDWEIGVHGRTAGFWDRKRGPIVRSDCTSCHDPHAPAFPPMKPGPGPHRLHLEKVFSAEKRNP
ncbi:MAG: hypothetical protein JWM99_2786 [Verrucomicrobiales bacterium]|nr:hypothetical protein [Verrucomicrobiales bacterium]